MSIIGFNFSKVYCERASTISGEVKIQHSASITGVDVVDLSLESLKQKVLRILFKFRSVYEPHCAEIEFAGEVLWLDVPENVVKLSDEWKKNGKLSEPVLGQVMFQIVSRCNIQALFLSRELNLPPPIPVMPRRAEEPPAKKSKKEKNV